MPNAVRYVVDASGHRTSVLVPVKVWENLNANYEKLQNKLSVFNSIENGLKELKRSPSTCKSLPTLKDFLK